MVSTLKECYVGKENTAPYESEFDAKNKLLDHDFLHSVINYRSDEDDSTTQERERERENANL
jgi:hypothetical protein